MEQTVARVEDAIARRKTTQHVAINAAKVVRYQHDEALRAAVDGCELATADGQPVVWASRILGRPLPERVAGIDLMDAFLDAARQRGHGVFLLGARAEVLERAEQEILRRYPGVRIVGRHHGYFGAEGEAEVVDEVAAATPDILFVALETPAKELFLARNRERLGVPFVMGVGGSFDVLAGERRRASAGCAVPGSNGSSGFRRTRADSPAATSWGTRSSSGSCCASELVSAAGLPSAGEHLDGRGVELVCHVVGQVGDAGEAGVLHDRAEGVVRVRITNAGRGSSSSDSTTRRMTSRMMGS